ncbi:MAG: DegT/DnrJ/EryC1/StrS aminotransferase family protein, partial [Nanoarchaeota archaeon]
YSYFGMDKDAFNRYSEKGSWFYQIIEPGYKYNMNNIQGALGVEQLKKLEKFIAKRRELAQHYTALLKQVPGLITPIEKNYTRHVYHLYPLLLNTEKISRDQFINKLKEYNIGTSVHFIPLHLHPYYQQKYNFNKGDFPTAEKLFENEVSLPLYPGMTLQDVEYVVDAIKEIIG